MLGVYVCALCAMAWRQLAAAWDAFAAIAADAAVIVVVDEKDNVHPAASLIPSI